MDEERLEQLEVKLAFAEHTINELNEAVIGQQQQIDRLTADYDSLLGRVRELVAALPAEGPDGEKPPHY